MDIRSSALVEGANEARRSTPLVVAWLVAFGLAVIVVAQMIVDPWAWALLGYPPDGTPASEIIQLFTNGATLLVLAAWVWLWERRRFRTIGFRTLDASRALLLGFAAGVALLAIPVLALAAVGQLRSGLAPAVTTAGADALPVVLGFIPVWLVQSGTEETVMRGYLLQRHALKLAAWPAILLVSVGFAIVHLDADPVALVNTVLFSVFLCFVSLAHGSLWPAIGIHAGWNMAQGNIFGIAVSGVPLTNSVFAFGPAPDSASLLTGGFYGLEASLVATVVLGVSSVAAYLYFLRAQAAGQI
ncbi:MAG: CPBP family intramembrane metalloprotease [Rhizobiaceae bacterium]|nr:CPBP family intramembrane metalloprotease [Rhizobiaceae bacterium]